MADRPVLLAGPPNINLSLYRRIRFLCHDTVVLIELPGKGTFAILRELEIDRARAARIADRIHVAREFTPASGLAGDREVANAQATAELLRREGVAEVWTDRDLPMLYAHVLGEAGVQVRCDPMMGVLERRAKDAQEVEWLREAQRHTETAMRFACEMIARASAAGDGTLTSDGAPLTSERVQRAINVKLLELGMGVSTSIVAGGPQGADPHHRGAGPLRTETLVIVDIFPQHLTTLYCGDCTRTVVHGPPENIPDHARRMHETVVEAKRAAIAATRAGVSGEAVHQAALDVVTAKGFGAERPPDGAPDSHIAMVHGTGHGIGLAVHEEPILAKNGPTLVVGDALTIEPGLYSKKWGGVRVEDMVIVREDGCESLNTLPEGLTWA